jgi:hypothetical protein
MLICVIIHKLGKCRLENSRFLIEKDDALFLMAFVEVIIGLHISRFWKRVSIMNAR